MKKFIVSILAILYLGMSSGIAMEIHYCMGQKAGAELFGTDNDKCGKCGMKEKKGGCCNDEHKFFKLKDDHKQAGISFSLDAPVCILPATFTPFILPVTEQLSLLPVNNNSPPPGPAGMDACILHGIFRL